MAQPATSDYFDVIQILQSVRLRAIVEVALYQVEDVGLRIITPRGSRLVLNSSVEFGERVLVSVVELMTYAAVIPFWPSRQW